MTLTFSTLHRWWMLFLCSAPLVASAQLTIEPGGYTAIQDPILLGDGLPTDFRSAVATQVMPLVSRALREDEAFLAQEAQRLLTSERVKAIAFVDRDQLVWLGYKDDYLRHMRLLSMSVSKSIVSVAAGHAICAGQMTLQTKAAELVPELKEKDLGQARLQDLLTMTSGTWEGNPDSSIIDAEQRMRLQAGSMGLKEILLSDKVSSAHRMLFSKRQPGEVFAYRSTDPLVVAHMLEMATGQPYSEYVDQYILQPAGIAQPAILGRDAFGFPRADGVVRMHMEDWIRVAIWIGQQVRAPGCLGDYMRQATTGQVNRTSRAFPRVYQRYGYFFGTDHIQVPSSFWAVGFGGQRIGWSLKNGRIVIAFANSDRYLESLYPLFQRWADMRATQP